MSKVEQANRYIDLIRVKSNEALLFLSLGKDSLVLLDLIYPKFDRIVCVFMYLSEDRVCSSTTLEPYLYSPWRYVLCAKSESKAIEVGRCGKGYAAYSWSLLYILRHEKS